MTTNQTNDDYKPNDYSLERLIAALLALLMFLPWIANGQETALPNITLGEAEQPGLLFRTGQPGVYAVAPVLRTDVQMRVAGPIVRTRVTQTFSNPTTNCLEGLYVFPLPEMSAVDNLRMTIGARVIASEIREKQEAARAYQQARNEGRRAALVEQHRPNIFTTAVATVMPGEEAVIEIEYQETARFENGEYSLRFPLVVAPRYTPPRPLMQIASLLAAGEPAGGPPDVTLNASVPEVSLSVELQPGYSLRDIRSPHHRISQETFGHAHYRLAVEKESILADRDFELIWTPDLGASPAATVLTEKYGDSIFALLMVTPPAQPPLPIPREVVFIIDSSGSMEGRSMEQAREALLMALDDLRPGDRFNVIDFDSEARPLFTTSRVAARDVIGEAKEFVSELTADGGTEMLSAIRLALPSGPVPAGSVRQVIFITDGQVGNEQELFRYIREHLGDTRLFTVGIGSAPNSHFMRNAARFGRGTFTYIGDLGQVKPRMAELFEKLGSPVMTAIDVKIDDPTAEIWPARVPDLYRGEPLLITARVTDPSAPVVLSGRIGNESWTARLQLSDPLDESGIARLWARQKIESAMDRLSEGVDAAVVRQEVVPVALRHRLVSQYTSLVAVDQSPLGLVGATCAAEMNEPSSGGQQDNAGTIPQTATPAQLYLMLGIAFIAASFVVRKVWS
jgi:Ca-activated chloride channel family protein